MRRDCAVIGSGPAGLEAALNLKIRNKSFILFGNPDLSRKIRQAPLVQNYLGLPSASGEDLFQAFSRHLKDMDIEVTHEMASLVYPMGDYFSIATGYNIYEAASVILATGVFQASSLKGEQEFTGRGVGYCATCDAALYRGKTVAIIGYTADSIREANFTAEIAGKVYFIPAGKFGCRPNPAVEVVDGKLLEIIGDKRVASLAVDGRALEVDGVFILRESLAPGTLVPGIKLADGFIEVDAAMRTSIQGCFAAGDCTGKPHQYIRAAGQGLTAAHSAVEYIDKAL
jgi:thioredoxin reductase (NADPH)